MERLVELVSNMDKSFKTADHLASVTFPLLKDPKLLVQIIWNLNKSLNLGMEALLYYERMYKRIGMYPENFMMRFEIFQKEVVPKYKISGDHVSLVLEVNDLIDKREKSPMEFRRKGEYIICYNDYKMKKLSIDLIKEYLLKAKPFILFVTNIINNDIRRRR